LNSVTEKEKVVLRRESEVKEASSKIKTDVEKCKEEKK